MNKYDEIIYKMRIQFIESKIETPKDMIEFIKNTLKYTLDIDDTVNWDKLKDTSVFQIKKPLEPNLISLPIEPKISDSEYIPDIGLIDKILPSLKEKKIMLAERRLNQDHRFWIKRCESIKEENEKLIEPYNLALQECEKQYSDFLKRQEEFNSRIDEKKKQYFNNDPDAIHEYCYWVLSYSKYPEFFPKEFEIYYNPENKIVIVDYLLPSIENIPTLSNVKYIKTRDEYKETHLSDRELKKLYDDLLYQISLRTIHELFEADTISALESIVFNGWVNSIDKSTGQNIKCCILSVQANRQEFLTINLELIDSKACFRKLKGVGSPNLHSLTPIAPILTIDKTDKRFISSYDIIGDLDKSTNLAAMDWEDFEHLVREIFEKEFTESGGEVKVTQSSRDGGVDAIAFDPDPIRGGKIVIQAKRYTNKKAFHRILL